MAMIAGMMAMGMRSFLYTPRHVGMQVIRNNRVRPVRGQLRVGAMIRVCPGRRHAWYESAIGPVRKQIGGAA